MRAGGRSWLEWEASGRLPLGQTQVSRHAAPLEGSGNQGDACHYWAPRLGDAGM